MESNGSLKLVLGLGLYISNFCAYGKADVDSSSKKKPLCPLQSYYQVQKRKFFVPSTLGYRFLIQSQSENSPMIPLSKTTVNPEKYLQFIEGQHDIPVSSSTKQNYTLISDGSPPSTKVGISNSPRIEKDGWMYYGKGFFLSVTSKDQISGVKHIFWSENNSDYISLKKDKIGYAKDGVYRVSYFACDMVGNRETLRNIRFKIDVSAPKSILREIKNNFTILNPQSFISLLSQDNGTGVHSIFYKFDQSHEFTKYNSELSLGHLTAGKHAITYYAKDLLGNMEEHKTHDFFFDPQPPKLDIAMPISSFQDGDIHYLSLATPIIFSAVDEESQIFSKKLWIDKKAWPEIEKPIYLEGKERLLVITGEGKDKAGNTAKIERKIFLDTQPPTIEHEILGPAFKKNDLYIATLPLRVRLRAEDTASGVKEIFFCLNDSPCQIYKDNIAINDPGALKLSYYAVDKVAQKSPLRTLNFRLKKAAVAKDIKIAAVKRSWVSHPSYGAIGPHDRPFRLVISDTPDDSGHQFFLTLPHDALQKEDIIDSFRHFIVSAAGYSAKLKIPIDQTSPITKHKYNNSSSYEINSKAFFGHNLSISLSAIDETSLPQSGVKNIFFSINGEPYAVYKNNLDTFIREQNYVVKYYAIDRVGNREDVKTLKFLVDLSPPKTKVSYNPPFYRNIIRRDKGLDLEGEDALSGLKQIYFRFNKDQYQKYHPKKLATVIATLKAGNHVLNFYGVDQVGNLEKENTVEIKIDDLPPLLSFHMEGQSHTIGQNLYVDRHARIKAIAKDDFSGTHQISYRIDDGSITTYQDPIQVTSIPNQSNIEIWAEDNLHQQSHSIKYQVIQDQTHPQTNITFKGTSYRYEDKIYIQPDTTIKLKGDDEESGVAATYYRINAGEYEKFHNVLKFKDKGEKQLTFYSTDYVGNREPPQTYRIIVDSESPQIYITTNEGQQINTAQTISKGSLIYISAIDTHAGIKSISYSINGQQSKLYRHPIAVNYDKSMRLEIKATDFMGAVKQATWNYKVR